MPSTNAAIAVDVSKNEKIGITAATYASRVSCPKDCALWDGCYAKFGRVGMITARLWRNSAAVNNDPIAVAKQEAQAIDGIKSGLPLRLHVVGDCATNKAAKIVSGAAKRYKKRFRNVQVWTYTHAHRKVKRENWGTVSVLASCETLKDAKEAMSRGYAAAVVVQTHPENGKAWKDETTGLRVIPCPAQTRDNVQCSNCRLCWDDTRLKASNSVISFEAHGVKKKSLLTVLN